MLFSPARDGEMIAVEVVAVDSKAALESVVWLGCVQYDGLRRVWETRTSQTVSQRLSQTNLLSIFGQSKVASCSQWCSTLLIGKIPCPLTPMTRLLAKCRIK